jgi:hypothetical protein
VGQKTQVTWPALHEVLECFERAQRVELSGTKISLEYDQEEVSPQVHDSCVYHITTLRVENLGLTHRSGHAVASFLHQNFPRQPFARFL